MEFKIISEALYNSIDWNLKENLYNMNIDEKKLYLEQYSLYRKLFTEYIISKLNLKEYDNIIKDSEFNLKANEIKDMDFYQYFSSEELKYFFVRNNVYINRLDENEKLFLAQKIKDENYNLDDSAIEFIEKTYLKVCTETEASEKSFFEEDTYIFYGPQTRRFQAPSDALVIGFNYNQFAHHSLSDDEWRVQNQNQQLLIWSTRDRMEVLLAQKIDMPVSIILYNEYSVNKIGNIV